MKRFLIIAAVAAAFAVPAGALADTTPSAASLASQSCKTQQVQLGAVAFKAAWGNAANAFGKCVSKGTHTATTALLNASQSCKAEQAQAAADFAAAHAGQSFAQVYGGGNTNANGKGAAANLFGKCVSTKAKAATQARTQAVVAAAKSCKADRTASATTFAATYGKGANAFGVCVSRKSSGKS